MKVVVDACSSRVVKEDNARVSNVQPDANRMEFELLANALPVVLPKEARAALSVVPFQEELNQEVLTATGLQSGTYQLTIDGEPVGCYTGAEFAAGINLAGNLKTPQYQQSTRITGLCIVRSDLGIRLRNLATFRYARAKQGQDPYDDAALAEQFLVMLTHQVDDPPSTRRAESVFPTCIEDPADEGVMEQLHEKLGRQISPLCRPVVHRYRVSRVSSVSP